MKLIIYHSNNFFKYSKSIIKVQKKYKPFVNGKIMNDYYTQEMNHLRLENKQFKI